MKYFTLGLIFGGSVGLTLAATKYGYVHSIVVYPALAALLAVLGSIIHENTRVWFRRRFPETCRLYAGTRLGPVFIILLLVHAMISWATDTSVFIPLLSYAIILEVVLYAFYTIIPTRSMTVLVLLSPVAAIAAVYMGVIGAIMTSDNVEAGFLLIIPYPPFNILYAPILSFFLAGLFGRARNSANQAL